MHKNVLLDRKYQVLLLVFNYKPSKWREKTVFNNSKFRVARVRISQITTSSERTPKND